MANPLILHCFDEDYRVNEEVVSKLFKNIGGTSNISASMDKLYETLSIMELEEEFMLHNLDKLDIIKLISRKTLTGDILLKRLDAAIHYILYNRTGSVEERYRIIKNHIVVNTSVEATEEAMIEFMSHIKFMIEEAVEAMDVEEMTEVEENNLIKLYHMISLLYSDNTNILTETKLDILDKLLGAGAIIYLLKNNNAPEIDDTLNLTLLENDFMFTVTLYPDLLTVRKQLEKISKLSDLYLNK